jgi:hypothetical protein
MNDDQDLIRALQSAVPRWSDDPSRDLWPAMLRRIDEAPARFGWLEAALAAAVVAAFFVFPEIVPVLLWHL